VGLRGTCRWDLVELETFVGGTCWWDLVGGLGDCLDFCRWDLSVGLYVSLDLGLVSGTWRWDFKVRLGDCLDLGLGGTWPWFRLGLSLGGFRSCGVSVCGGISLLDYFKMLDVYLKLARWLF